MPRKPKTEELPNLTKREIVTRISEETGLTQLDVAGILQRALDAITDALATGQNVEFRNFGVFEVKLTKPRVGRNPKAPDQEVTIPPRAVVKFKAGKIMRQRVLLRTREMAK